MPTITVRGREIVTSEYQQWASDAKDLARRIGELTKQYPHCSILFTMEDGTRPSTILHMFPSDLREAVK